MLTTLWGQSADGLLMCVKQGGLWTQLMIGSGLRGVKKRKEKKNSTRRLNKNENSSFYSPSNFDNHSLTTVMLSCEWRCHVTSPLVVSPHLKQNLWINKFDISNQHFKNCHHCFLNHKVCIHFIPIDGLIVFTRFYIFINW